MQRVGVRIDRAQVTYPIMLGNEILDELGTCLEPLLTGRQALLVTNPKVNRLYGGPLLASLEARDVSCRVLEIPAGERYKNINSFRKIVDAAFAAGLDRSDTVIALGGGVIGDLAGYAAASLYRGVRLVHVPTTVVAQQDSSIGGKVGIDVAHGKNLVGAFYQPALVFTDVATLKTLAPREFRNGMAEVIKHGVIGDRGLFNRARQERTAILARAPESLLPLIHDALRVKVAVVTQDEKEKGLRATLNYGHTVGHALEGLLGYKGLKHGEAIAIGMDVAARLGYLMKLAPRDLILEQRDLLNKYKLPVSLPPVDLDRLWDFVMRDKKVAEQQIRFILPTTIGNVEIVSGVTRELLREAVALAV